MELSLSRSFAVAPPAGLPIPVSSPRDPPAGAPTLPTLTERLGASSRRPQGVVRAPPPPRTGQYNPLTNEWAVTPRDAKYQDPSYAPPDVKGRRPAARQDLFHKHDPIAKNHPQAPDPCLLARERQFRQLPDKPQHMGKYNPITCEWVLAPADPNMMKCDGPGYVQSKGNVRFDRGVLPAAPPPTGKYNPVTAEWVVAPAEEIQMLCDGAGYVKSNGATRWDRGVKYDPTARGRHTQVQLL